MDGYPCSGTSTGESPDRPSGEGALNLEDLLMHSLIQSSLIFKMLYTCMYIILNMKCYVTFIIYPFVDEDLCG